MYLCSELRKKGVSVALFHTLGTKGALYIAPYSAAQIHVVAHLNRESVAQKPHLQTWDIPSSNLT